jgi:hypothetical protein
MVQGDRKGQGLSVGVKAASAGCAGEFLSAWSTDRAIVFAQCPCPSRLRHSLPVDASHTWQASHPSAASSHGPRGQATPQTYTRAHVFAVCSMSTAAHGGCASEGRGREGLGFMDAAVGCAEVGDGGNEKRSLLRQWWGAEHRPRGAIALIVRSWDAL